MHIFQGVTVEKSTEGWPMGINCGASVSDGEQYAVGTIPMSGTEIPDACTDAKTFAQLTAGLLNAYYSGFDVSGLSEEQVIKLGLPIAETNIPHPENTEIPFTDPTLPF